MGLRKILHVIPTLDQSGAEKQLALLAANLPKDRFEVMVCALTRGGHFAEILRSAGIHVELINKRLKADPMALWQLKNLMQRWKPHIVQTWLFAANCYGRLAAKWAKAPCIIASERCVDSWKRQYQLAIDRKLANWTNRIVANSEAVKEFYAKVGIPMNKLHVIANAVDVHSAPNADEISARLAQFDVKRDRPIIGFIGRLWPQKRVQDLIWAADILRIDGIEFQVAIVGDGPRRAALERFVHGIEIEQSVHFLGHQPNARDLISAMDIVVIPSSFEGMPNTVLEAMQAGKPVIATRIAGMDEVVVDQVTGILVPPKQPFELARAIRDLLANESLREQMGAAAKKRAANLFTLERMVNDYVELYDELVLN